MNCQLALIYIRAMDVMEKVLEVDRVQAVIGGHSKRGRSATVAAAMDSRVASPIIMGNEGIYRTDQIQWHLSFHHAFFQDQVNVPVFYIGATNEGGYNMFNINLMQERLKQPMTIEMIPELPALQLPRDPVHRFHDVGRPHLRRPADQQDRRHEPRVPRRSQLLSRQGRKRGQDPARPNMVRLRGQPAVARPDVVRVDHAARRATTTKRRCRAARRTHT